MTRARIGSGAGIGSANCCFAEGCTYPGRAWTQAHRRWVNGLTWPHPADRVVVDDYLLAIDHLEARRLVVEAAWHYRHRPGVSRTFAQRRSGQPRVIALADKAQQRLWSGALDFASLAVRMLDGGGTRRRTYPN